jgi:hypothetical protein
MCPFLAVWEKFGLPEMAEKRKDCICEGLTPLSVGDSFGSWVVVGGCRSRG